MEDRKLQMYLNDFWKCLEDAQDARTMVLHYLRNAYDVDTNAHARDLSESLDQCLGINEEYLYKLISRERGE